MATYEQLLEQFQKNPNEQTLAALKSADAGDYYSKNGSMPYSSIVGSGVIQGMNIGSRDSSADTQKTNAFREAMNKQYGMKSNFTQADTNNMLDAYAKAAGWNMSAYSQPAATATPSVVKSQPIKTEAFGGLRSVDATLQYDKEGRPIRNPYSAVTDANGTLLDQFNLTKKIGDDVKLNTQGLDAIRERALSTGPSVWAMLQKDKNALETRNAVDKANQSSAAATNSAFSQLASRGGMSAGQRERVAASGGRNAFTATQGIKNQNMLNNFNVDLQDQQQKDQFLSALPGLDMNAANFNQSQRAYRNQAQDLDIQRGMRDVQGFNAYNSSAFDKAMQEWGASKTADAQRAAAGSGGGGLFGGCFMTTAACVAMQMPDDCWVLEDARKFRDTYMFETPERAFEISEYYQTAPAIVEKISKRADANKVWKRLFWKSIVPFVLKVREGNNEEAHKLYKAMMFEAKNY